MKALIIGYGSIGRRHVRLLQSLDCEVAVVSRRQIDYPSSYSNFKQAFDDHQPNYIVIANKTSEHFITCSEIVRHGFKERVLIEKPLFEKYHGDVEYPFSIAAVAYNLRFHPLLLRLKKLVSEMKIFSCSVYVGSYLPAWRPATDYRHGYSAKKNEGGGVLRDLSHEIDIVYWLFGKWHTLTADGGHFSDLEITSDDVYSIIMKTEICPLVSIHMNYLDRLPRRDITMNTDKGTFYVDLNNNTIAINGIKEFVVFDVDEPYIEQHKAMFNQDTRHICSIKDAQETLITIDAVENASVLKKWITK